MRRPETKSGSMRITWVLLPGAQGSKGRPLTCSNTTSSVTSRHFPTASTLQPWW